MAVKVVIKLDGLESIAKAFKNKLPVVRIGVLGKDTRSDGKTNAEIGAAHEFGTSTIPQRSFLRMPLIEKLDSELDKSDLKKEDYLKEVIKTKSIVRFMKRIAKAAEAVVSQAFSTGGFGKWARWKNPNYKNNSGQLLVDTAQLRDSISSEVK